VTPLERTGDVGRDESRALDPAKIFSQKLWGACDLLQSVDDCNTRFL
jgi:hypothetical protein